MKTRILPILAALCLCLTLLPTAWAADTTTQEVNNTSDLTSAIAGTCDIVKLTDNIEISSTLQVNRAVTLDLNGYVLKMTGSSRVITVASGGKLTLTDSRANDTTANHYFTVGDTGLWSLCTATNCSHEHKTVTGGVITGGKNTGSNAQGGGVFVSAGSGFTMEGGHIVGCTASASDYAGTGGGVYVFGTFTMNGGSITGCTAIGKGSAGSGGGVYVAGTFTMNGGTIERCTAKGGDGTHTSSNGTGGGVYVRGTFTMNGGTIERCTAEGGSGTDSSGNGEGGGVCVAASYSTSPTFTMNGGSITGCTASSKGTGSGGTAGSGTGGGVYIDNADCALRGGTVSSNTATNSGGGVFVSNERTLTVGGSTTTPPTPLKITGNTSGTTSTADNAYLDSNSNKTAKLTVASGGLTNGSRISVGTKADDTTILLEGNFTNYLSCFVSDKNEYGFSSDGKLVKICTVTFDLNGGSTVDAQYVLKGQTATEPSQVPTRTDDYVFGGWCTDSTCNTAFDFSTVITADTTLYAKWTAKTYTVTYAAGANGTGTITAGTKTHCVAFTLSSDTFTRTGYTQTGWATSDGGEKVYDLGGSYTADAAVTLYPVWTATPVYIPVAPPTYSITAPTAANGTITVSPKNAAAGVTVTITTAPDTGYTLETLTVLDKNGSVLPLTDLGGGKYSFQMPAGSVTVAASFMDDNTMLNFFVDVTADKYYYNAVLWAVKNGITGGVDENHFGPDLNCTRAQLVTFLWRAAGCPVVNYAMNFADVGDGYYTEAVRWAASLGIVGGYGDGLFGAGDDITREQLVTILYRFAVAMGMDVSVGEDTNILSYSDALTVGEYAVAAMQWAVGAGIVQGADGSLMPQDSCTRAQIVTMLYRLLGE